MTVCYFGIYNPDYPRNKNLILGLRSKGVTVHEVVDSRSGYGKYWRPYKAGRCLRSSVDAVIVGFPGQLATFLAWLVFRRPIVLDLHVSYYDSIVIERQQCSRYSFRAVWLYLLDRYACLLADRVLIDTKEHADYIASLLRIPREKIAVVYHGLAGAGSQETKTDQPNQRFIVSFHGYIQPLNGMDLVVRAMAMLKNDPIILWVIGGGSEYGATMALAKELGLHETVVFFPPLPRTELFEKLTTADLGLGFFSISKKIDRVIANKVYELMSLGVPVLTGESKAMREHFIHREHVFFCERGSAQAIADAVRELYRDPGLRKRLAADALEYVSTEFTPERIGEQVLEAIQWK